MATRHTSRNCGYRFGAGILELAESGAVTNRCKNYLPGRMVATFAPGTARLYRFMHRNPSLEMHPAGSTNDPWLAARNDNLVAINGALQVDLLGQCGSGGLGPSPCSGSGGQADFVRAANRSRGGKAIIVLPCQLRGDRVRRGAAARRVGSTCSSRTLRRPVQAYSTPVSTT